MKININIEVSPSELIELQDVVHEGAREVVAKLTGKDMAHKILEHLEENPNQVAYHIPADHMETGTVIQGKPPQEPEAADIRPGDLVKVQWPDEWDMPDEWYATYGDTYRVEEIVPRPVAFVRPIGKETILPYIADVEWLSRVEPEPVADSEYRVGDLVELHWEGKKSDSPNVLYRITELHDNGTVSLRPNTFPSFEVFNISKEWISRPLRKVELRGDEEWITPDTADPQPTPPRPMRDPGTRIQTGDHVIVRPFTGYNEIFTVLAANNGRALLLGEIGEEETQELSNLLPVWPDSEGNYCFHRNDTAAEPPEE